MSLHRGVGRRALTALLLGPAILLLLVLLPARPAAAHPLDVYLQATYLTLAPSQVTVELNLSPGVLVAPQVLAALDVDQNQQISENEARAYAEQVLSQVEVRVDDQLLAVALSDVEVSPYLTVQSGYGTLRVRAAAAGAPATAGDHQIFVRNGFAPTGSEYQVNAFVEKDAPVVLGAQHRDDLQQQSLVEYRIDPAAAAAGTEPGADDATAQAGQLLGYLQGAPLVGWAMLLALGFAALLGALHALTPGHAKTLMAAYLVGSGGTARNAIALGAVITFTHTASVIIIGLVALLASELLVPGVLVPGLEILAGLLVVALGLRLLRRRWSARRSAAQPHDHTDALVHAGSDDGSAHGHHHGDGDTGGHGHGHSHGGRPHTHGLPAGGITPRGLVAMGVAGGLVPCPEALGVMVLAVGVNQTALGLGLILAFSVGLAAVLMGLGLLLVRSRTLVARFDRINPRWSVLLPVLSAVVVTVLGLGLIVQGLGASLS